MKNLAIIVALSALASCNTHSYQKRDGIQVRGSLGVAHVEALAEVDGEKGTAEPFGMSGRIEFANDVTKNVSAGIRIGYGQQVRDGDTRAIGPDTIEENATLKSKNADVVVVFRGYVPTDSTVRPYIEGNAGLRHMSITSDFQDGQQGYHGKGIGFTGGVAAGLEWRVSKAFRLFGQADYTYGKVRIDDLSVTTNAFGMFLGGEVSF